MITKSKIKKSLIALASAAVIAPIMLAFAHEGDLKLRDWEPPVFGPAWRLDDSLNQNQQQASTAFSANGIRLMSWFPCNTFDASNTSGNDVWGYVSPSGREYALMGLSNGTGIVEVTNPGSANIIKFIVGPTSMWRNIKTYKTYAYAVSEGGGGIQVFDLSQIDNGIVTELPSVTTGGSTATHTMIINTQTGYLYRMGGSTNGIRVYNLEPNPASPAYVSAWNPKYTHDGSVYNWTTGPYAGKEIFFACGGTNGGNTNTGLDILDITNKANITVIGRFTYSQAAFCHQVWLSENRQFAYINDELDEDNFGVNSRGIIVNISNLAAPVSGGTYTTGVTSIDHNEYVKGNLLHCSNYTSGIRLFDITTPSTPVQVAWFDTYPDDDAAPASTFNGLWSNYPYLPSGIILGSDIERGLFVWKIGAEPATVTYPEGQPNYFSPTGQRVAVQVATSAGYSVPAGGVVLKTTVGASTTTTTMDHEGGGLYAVTSPSFPSDDCGNVLEWSIEVTTNDGSVLHDPFNAVYSATLALGTQVTLNQTFEANATGWVIGGSADGTVASTGTWVWADPIGTIAQPENDHTDPGVKCFVTGNATAGSGDGTNDVDSGQTTLTSPLLSVSGLSDPYVSYWRWYSNDKGGAPGEDSMPIYISGNNGTNWVLLESVTENANAWVSKQFRVADFVTVTAAGVKLKFVARDLGTGSLVEAAIDDVTIFELQCPKFGDLNGDGEIDSADLGLLLLDFGPCPGCASDLDGSGEVDSGDIGWILLSYGS